MFSIGDMLAEVIDGKRAEHFIVVDICEDIAEYRLQSLLLPTEVLYFTFGYVHKYFERLS